MFNPTFYHVAAFHLQLKTAVTGASTRYVATWGWS